MTKMLTFGLSLAVLGLNSVSAAPAVATERESEAPKAVHSPLPQRTISMIPSGVDTYTAFIEENGVGAGAVGLADGRPESAGGNELSGGLRLWGSFVNRVVVQADVGNDAKGKFVPSLSAAVRVLGDRERGWALGVLGRYRTEGFKTVEGEIEAGLLGGFQQRRLHLDIGLIAGVGVEEEEADGELLARFGYDLLPALRLGAEVRARRELAEEEEAEAVEGGEWDAFGGPQLTVAYEHFYSSVTAGIQKPRFTEDAGWMAQLVIGGIAF